MCNKSSAITNCIKSPQEAANGVRVRMATIMQELVQMHLACNERIDKAEMQAKVKIAAKDWEEIPTNELPNVCSLARQQNKTFKMPTTGQIIEAWRQIGKTQLPTISKQQLEPVNPHRGLTINEINRLKIRLQKYPEFCNLFAEIDWSKPGKLPADWVARYVKKMTTFLTKNIK